MTDTPAVVSLTFGLVLKCFFIFPATDNWWSFSHSPSSWMGGEGEKKHLEFVGKYCKWMNVRESTGSILTVTQGCSSTWRAEYLWSTSTSSIDRISSCSTRQTMVSFSIPNKHASPFTMHTSRRGYSPWLSPTRCPSTVEGILAVPLVSDRTALLDRHCSCEQNISLHDWVFVRVHQYGNNTSRAAFKNAAEERERGGKFTRRSYSYPRKGGKPHSRM